MDKKEEEEIKNRIIEAARIIYRIKGDLPAEDVNRISSIAKVDRETLHKYFPNKASLLKYM